MKDERQQVLESIKLEATSTLAGMKVTLEGILIEIKSGQRRNFDSNDFVIDEFRALVQSINRLTDQLARLP